jgi:hypothetical protein
VWRYELKADITVATEERSHTFVKSRLKLSIPISAYHRELADGFDSGIRCIPHTASIIAGGKAGDRDCNRLPGCTPSFNTDSEHLHSSTIHYLNHSFRCDSIR